MKATDIRKGHVLMIDGQPCRVMDFTHRTPGNLRAFVQVRFRNLVSGNTFDQRLAATDFLNEARLDTKEMQVLDRKSTRLNSSHGSSSYAVFCLKKKKKCVILPFDLTIMETHSYNRVYTL